MFDIKKDFDFIPCKLRENSEKKKARHVGVWIIIVNLACLYYQIYHYIRSDGQKWSQNF